MYVKNCNNDFNKKIDILILKAKKDQNLKNRDLSFLYLIRHRIKKESGVCTKEKDQTFVLFSRAFLSRELRCCVNTITEMTTRLQKLGYIEKLAKNNHKALFYTLKTEGIFVVCTDQKTNLNKGRIRYNPIGYISNPNQINQNKSEEEKTAQIDEEKTYAKACFSSLQKKPNTTTQDMIRIYNEITNCHVDPSKPLCKMLYAAFQRKFLTLDSWKNYLTHKVKGKIKHGLRFLMFLLQFSVINDVLATVPEPSRDIERIDFFAMNEEKKTEIVDNEMDYLKTKFLECDNNNEDKFKSWFSKITVEKKDNVLFFKAMHPIDSMFKNYQQNFLEIISQDFIIEWVE